MAPAMTQPLAETADATAQPVLEAIPPLRLGDQWGRHGKEYLAAAREILFARHLAGASGETIVRAWTGVVDHLVQSLYGAAVAGYAAQFTMLDQRVALIAQGGYGRAELNPCSDIDLLFLYPQRADAFVETVNEKVLYALVGHRPQRRPRGAQRARLREARRPGSQGEDGAARHALPGGRCGALSAGDADPSSAICSSATRRASSATRSPRAASATAATATRCTWSSRTSRKARAVCATCTRRCGWPR